MAKKLTQEEIFETALKTFARYGFRRARVEDVAKDLNVAVGTLYRYVKDKKDLYERTVEFGIRSWQGRVMEAIQGMDNPLDKFRLMGMKGYDYLEQEPDLRQILMDDPTIFPLSPRKIRFPEIDSTSISLIKSILTDGVEQKVFRDVDIEATANILYSIYVMFIIKTYVKSEETSTRQMFEKGLELILHGLVNV